MDDAADADAAVRSLCGSLFDGRASVEQVTHHPIDRSLDIAPHRHPWMLQVDLMVRCGGRATVDGVTTDLRRCTMMTTYPGQRHGYRLLPERGNGHVYHLKLAVRRHRGLPSPGPFPPILTDQPEPTALRRTFEELTRLHEAQPHKNTLFLASVARVVALWPTMESVTSAGTQLVSEAILSGTRPDERLPLGKVLELIDRRLDDPPPLSELAAMSHVSTRHFARRFKATMGCTPLAYVNGRRLRGAKRLLTEPDRAIRDVGRAMGFPSPPAFTRWFKQQVGQTPQAFRDDPTRM
ncbi:MAG: AraC family transcriptional regulator [Planctomycetota bacterium]